MEQEKDLIIYSSEVDTSDEAIEEYRMYVDEDLDDESIIELFYDDNRDDWENTKEAMDQYDEKNNNASYIIEADLGFWDGRRKATSPQIHSLREAVCACWGDDSDNTFIVKENKDGNIECEYHHHDGTHYFSITRVDKQPINFTKELWG